jgi:hypothetical protein
MKTKKLTAILFFFLMGLLVRAQNGLENIIVEKYYVSNAADAAQADTESIANGLPTGALPAGSVTYRFYADLLPGYKIVQVYADRTRNQSLKFTTTTSFYNNVEGTSVSSTGTSKATIKNNLRALDSYLTLGGVANGQSGILKAEDNGVANNVTTASNANGVLLNNDPSVGIPLTTQDGMIAGTILTPAFAGLTPVNEAVFADATVASNNFEVLDGSMYSTSGAVGPVAATNKVLIAQITTDGTLHYELNILLVAPDGSGQYFVAGNPESSDIVIPSLSGTLNGGNIPPYINITAPFNNTSYPQASSLMVTADAGDTDGTVTGIDFFVDGIQFASDLTPPYTANYTITTGAHVLTAAATDNNGAQAISGNVTIHTDTPANLAPDATITAPADGEPFHVNDPITITADATDPDGSISVVLFLVDGGIVGRDSTAPYIAFYNAALGTHYITAIAIDNLGTQANSAPVSINVTDPNNILPTVNITAPVSGTFYTAGTTIEIKANANDSDGTVTSVSFYVDGNYIDSDDSSPYTATYITAPGNHILTATATDNSNDQTTSAPVTISVINTNSPNGLENILVEKYYVANAADAAQADAESVQNGLPTGALPVGSVTYRFYADLLPGYKILEVFADGTKNHSLKFTTTTSFYNSPNGTFSPANTKTTIKNQLLTLDSYLTLGAAAIGNYGIIKTEDNGAANNVTVAGNPAGVLLNNDPSIGLPLTTQDGMIAAPGTIIPSFIGLSADNEAAIGDGAILSNTMDLIDGAVYTTSGATGPDTVTNKVLIAQITTNGTLNYELNLLIVAPDGTGQYFVAQNPIGDEITISSLKGTLDGGNILPVVAITAPNNGAFYPDNASVTISANAADTDGSIASVEFLVDNVSIGIDATAPYAVNYIATTGNHVLTAKATDNNSAQAISTGSVINVGTPPNNPPTVSVTAPVDGVTVNVGTAMVITANANDTDGSISAVEFFVDGNSVGIDSIAPYSVSYTATIGTHYLKATATDNLSAQVTSSSILIKVIDPNNIAPSITILTPTNGASYPIGTAVSISTDAIDTDGYITSVRFYIDGFLLATVYGAPYTTIYNTNTAGSHTITAIATDNTGGVTTSAPVTISVLYAQNGLENISVEKYYVSNAADATQADQESLENSLPTGALPVGSVTYRFYADMLPGYKILQVYADGTRNQSIKFATTTSFYNNPNGSISPGNTSKSAIKNKLLALDSYLTMGSVANGNYGILKAEDDGVANNITVNANPAGVLLNNNPSLGIPLTSQDGMIAGPGTIIPAFSGLSSDNEAAFGDGTLIKNTLEFIDGAIYTTTAVAGPIAATNKVLIAQVTTNGALHYELNVLLMAPDGSGHFFVARNPQTGDVVVPSLMGSLIDDPISVEITDPVNNAVYLVGTPIAIGATVNATNPVTSVEFLLDGISIGTDNSAPYTIDYTASTPGTYTLIAKATGNSGVQAISNPVNIVVYPQDDIDSPVVTITSPVEGATYPIGTPVTITADATDADGSVASVEFFVDGISIGIDHTAPYAISYIPAIGAHTLIAKATDNGGLSSNSTPVHINIFSDGFPVVVITSPVNGAVFVTGSSVSIDATADDPDGTITSVEFFVDGTSVGVDNSAPYTANYIISVGFHVITAKSTDNTGLITTSAPVNISASNPNSAPTVVITSPANGSAYVNGNVVTITADATDNIMVASVEFFVDGISVGIDNSAPYAASYTAVAGSHSLTAKATDNDGLSTTSTPVVITVINTGGQPYILGDLFGLCTNPSLCLPIMAIDTVKNVIGYDLVLNYDKTKVNPTGNVTLYNALLNAGYASYAVNNDAANGLINISVFLNATAPANAAFNGTGPLLCVEFTKLPGLLASDTTDFNVSFLQESYATGVSTKLANAGSYTNTKSTTYGGSLKFWSDNSAIRYNKDYPAQYRITNIYGTDVNCANKSLAVQPDVNGNFVYDAANRASIQIERDILPATDVQVVINGFDASLGHKVLVNDLSFIPTIYQAIALDVNTDGVISAGDISQINQRSVKTILEFKQKWNYNNNGTSNGQLSKDWLFLDNILLVNPAYKKSLTYPANDGTGYSKAKVPVVPFCLQVPVVSGNSCPVYTPSAYTGVLLGDVNGNYDAIPADGQIKKQAGVEAMGTVYMNLDQATAGAGYIDIPVSFVSSEKVVALDFATKFNENALSFEKVIANVSYLTDALANVAADDKILRFTSNSTQVYEADKNIVSIRFKTRTGNLANADISAVRGFLNGTEVKLELKGTITTGISANSSNISVQVYPNPASNVINVVSPERAVVELLDLQGRQIVISTMVNANEKQEINTEKIASGMYMIKISNEHFISTQRITIDN